MSPQYGKLSPLLAGLGHPSKFQRVLRLGFLLQRQRSAEANQTLHHVWPSPALVHYIYTLFGGFCLLMEFCQVQTSLCVQVLRSPILAALLHDSRPVGVSQALQCGTRNGIMELLQTAPPIFGWAAITLGMGPHSSFFYICKMRNRWYTPLCILFLACCTYYLKK